MTRTLIKTGAMVILFLVVFWFCAFVLIPLTYAGERYYANIEGALTYTSPLTGRTAEFPPIGSLKYSEGCIVTHVWEDMSARAYCPEDGAVYWFDPDGQPHINNAGMPVRGIGWYPAD